MNYYLDPISQYSFADPTPHVGKNQVMQVLEHVFDPSGTRVSTFKDCILISLDLEYSPSTQRIQQVGLAILDSREICNMNVDESATGLILSRLLLLEKSKVNSSAYLFGRPEQQYYNNLGSLLLSAFTVNDTRDTTKLRNIILVGHGIKTDIEVLKTFLGFDVLSLPMIKAIVDTSPLANRLFQISGQHLSLRRTCMYMGMYRRNLHNAGNDAMYTLKALLLMFHYYKDQKLSQSYDTIDGSADQVLLYEYQLEVIKKIGRCNNGIGRFAEKRRKKPFRKGEKAQDPDLMHLDDEISGGVMTRLFQT